jgi:hypothetical protein
VHNNPLSFVDPSGFDAEADADPDAPGYDRWLQPDWDFLFQFPAIFRFDFSRYVDLIPERCSIHDPARASCDQAPAPEPSGSTVERRPTVQAFGEYLDNNIAGLQALLATDYAADLPPVEPYTIWDGIADLVNGVGDAATAIQIATGIGTLTAGATQAAKRRTVAELVDVALVRGVSGPSGRASAMKYLERRWDRATFPKAAKSIEYHIARHARGMNVIEYTQRAESAFADTSAARAVVRDLLGRDAVRITSSRGSGLFTPDGRIIWFHPL